MEIITDYQPEVQGKLVLLTSNRKNAGKNVKHDGLSLRVTFREFVDKYAVGWNEKSFVEQLDAGGVDRLDWYTPFTLAEWAK